MIDKVIELKDGLKQRFDKILEAISSRDSILEEFHEEIFNALVEKIEFSHQRILFLSMK